MIEGSGNLQSGNASVSGEGIVFKAVQVIESKDVIPTDAKKAIKDYLLEKQQEIMNSLDELDMFSVPDDIAQYWDIVVEVFNSLM